MTREMAIEELQRHRQEFAHDHGWSGSVLDALDEAIQALQAERCDDAISRQRVLDIVEFNSNSFDGNDAVVWIEREIKALPSIQPQKVGKWLLFDDESNSYCCSACNTAYMLIEGTPKDNGYKYCPSCGAKMKEGE